MNDQPKFPDQNKVSPPSPPVVKTEPVNADKTEPATAEQLSKVEKEMTGFERATLRWAKLAVGLSALAAIFVCAQWYEMHEGGIDTHNLAEAAKSTATTADNTLKSYETSFRQEERAYLWASSFNVSNGPVISDPKGRHVCADVHIVNSGKTPAIGVHLWRYATYGPNAEQIIKAFRPPAYLTPSGDMLGTIGDKWGTAFTPPVDKATEKALLEGSESLYIYGVVQYFDIFGNYHETGFCSQRVLRNTPFIVCNGFGNWFDKRPEDKANNPN